MRYYVNFAFKSFFCIEIDVFFLVCFFFWNEVQVCRVRLFDFRCFVTSFVALLAIRIFKFYCFKLFLAKLSVAIQMEHKFLPNSKW